MPSRTTLIRIGFIVAAIALAYIVEAVYDDVRIAALVLLAVGWVVPTILLNSEST